jgi:nitrogenase molybdenum-iron protein NifN
MKNRNFVNLNINPCKMCMPMGAVLAMKGVENSMILLHGSQGCSTYIRRHMAGHYNEPVDVASSSLNEEGTVYGGESNLKKALRNVISLYAPSVIGVASTCLAETIGEDIRRIISEFIEEEEPAGCSVVPIPAPGYGGSQFEGYFAALNGIVKELAANARPNGKINVVLPNLNPGDVRNIKSILDVFRLEYNLLPDVSETLDAPYSEEFRRIPAGGTSVEDIRSMAGARATIELGVTVPEGLSPGRLLLERFDVPFYSCPLPVGVRNTDLFVRLLSELSGRPVPAALRGERGRLLDGMVDSHKYNAEGRAVLFGEPELAYALSCLCAENGITRVLVGTGSRNGELKRLVEEEWSKGTERDREEKPLVLSETDFETIQDYVVKRDANILIGNSDGKAVTEKTGVPLVRAGFPIHDRVGGQRLAYMGYGGSLMLLDAVTNALLEQKYGKYRSNMLEKYYRPESATAVLTPSEKTASHPCFSSGACGNARMHIPVAPECNISCNYCNRKYDCVNESRPGVTSEVLSPEEAAAKVLMVRDKIPGLKVVGIAGPGDALADFDTTARSIERIREVDPGLTFCLSTNGLMLPFHADELIRLGVSHVTITINAIDPDIGAKIYRQVNYMGRKLKGREGAEILLANQLAGLSYLSWKGVVCKVNIVMIKGVNDRHIEAVVRKVKECGAFMTNIMPLIPARGSVFEKMPMTSNKELNELRRACEADLKQMYHCRQCRADAIGILGEDRSPEFRLKTCAGCGVKGKDRGKAVYTFAVATKSGMLVDQHFGQVREFHIYEYREGAISLVERRPVEKYCGGPEECDGEENKIDGIMKTVGDCNAVLVMRIGYSPMKRLEDANVKVVQICGTIEEAVKKAVDELEGQEELMETVGRQ